MSTIRCKAKAYKIGSWSIVRLPQDASAKLPSRGMTMAKGAINDIPFQAALEPDGKKSHWFRLDDQLRKQIGAVVGDAVTLAIEPLDDWPEPELPADLRDALDVDPVAQRLWRDTTTKARWDWIRWLRATHNPQTRQTRIDKARSMLKSGKRRPCCFNRSLCTEPSVSKSGVLLSSRRGAAAARRSRLAASDRKGNEMAAVNVRCFEDVDLDAVEVKHVDERSL